MISFVEPHDAATPCSAVWLVVCACASCLPARPRPASPTRPSSSGRTSRLQGGKNAYGVAAQQGAKLYIDQVNAAGGVHGRKLVLRTLDDDNKTGQRAGQRPHAGQRRRVPALRLDRRGPVDGDRQGGARHGGALLRPDGRLAGPAAAVRADGVPGARRAPRGVPRPDGLGQERRPEDGWLLPRGFGHRPRAPAERQPAGQGTRHAGGDADALQIGSERCADRRDGAGDRTGQARPDVQPRLGRSVRQAHRQGQGWPA